MATTTHPTLHKPGLARTHTAVAFVAGVVLTLIMSSVMLNAWSAGAATTAPGDTYVAIDPTRAYDGRISSYAQSGPLAPNASKVISIKDGHDTDGKMVSQNVVPVGATSVTYNLTIAGPTGPNFVAVTPGDASSFQASAINFTSGAIANAANVKIDANRQIKIWGGNQTGSMSVIIDITGYYIPASSTTTTTTTTTTTMPAFDGSMTTLAVANYEIQTRGDIPGKATDSGTSSTFNRVRFSVTNGAVTGVPGDDGNPSNAKTSNVDPGSTFDSNTIKVTIAGGFTDPANPTSIGSRWDFKVMEYANGVLKGTYARTDTPTDTGTFQMCNTSCATDLPAPTASVISPSNGPTTCSVPSTSATRYTVQFTGTTPGVAPPSNPSNNRFDVRFATATTGAITGNDFNDGGRYTRPSGAVVCSNRTVTVIYDDSPSFSSPTGTWTLYNIVANGTGFTGDYTSDASTGVTGVQDVGTFTMVVNT